MWSPEEMLEEAQWRFLLVHTPSPGPGDPRQAQPIPGSVSWKHQRGFIAEPLSLGSKSSAGGAAEAGKPPEQRCTPHTSHTCSLAASGAFHCQNPAWGWRSARAEPLRAQGRARDVNTATEPAPPELPAPKPHRGCVRTPLLGCLPWRVWRMLHPGGCCIPGGSAAASPAPGPTPRKDQAGKPRVPHLTQGRVWGSRGASVCVTAAQTEKLRRSFYLNYIRSVPNSTCCFI